MYHAISFGRVLVNRRILTPVSVLALMLVTLLVAVAPALAQEGGGGPVTATGVLERAAPHSPDPTPVYAITDEEAGTSYELVSGFVDLERYVGERVSIRGVPVPGPGDPSKPPLLNVTEIRPAGDAGGGETEREATLSFELTVAGDPPAGARFFGVVPAEGCISVPLADPEGDGLYIGSTDVPKFAPGGPSEPVSLPVQIVQADDGAGPCNPTRMIKDFGLVKIDGDKTFTASVSFRDDRGSDNNSSGGGSDDTASDDSSGDADSGSPANSGSVSGSLGSGTSDGEEASGSGDAFGPLFSSGMQDLLLRSLPVTSGIPLILGAVGILLIAGGLLVRKVFR